MKKEELDEIINKLESLNSQSDAYIAFYQYGGGIGESFARANKEGLELFAVQLLRAAKEIENIEQNKEGNIIPLNYKAEWIDGDIFIQYIQPVNKKDELTKEDLYESTVADKLIPAGCFAIIIFLLISTIVGVKTILKLLF